MRRAGRGRCHKPFNPNSTTPHPIPSTTRGRDTYINTRRGRTIINIQFSFHVEADLMNFLEYITWKHMYTFVKTSCRSVPVAFNLHPAFGPHVRSFKLDTRRT